MQGGTVCVAVERPRRAVRIVCRHGASRRPVDTGRRAGQAEVIRDDVSQKRIVSDAVSSGRGKGTAVRVGRGIRASEVRICRCDVEIHNAVRRVPAIVVETAAHGGHVGHHRAVTEYAALLHVNAAPFVGGTVGPYDAVHSLAATVQVKPPRVVCR